MAVKVLVVDDSSFFRRQIQKLLEEDSELEVIGTANDGKEAIEKTLALKPDVITMDIEMPVLDGIKATKQIMQQRPTPILMFSSLSTEGAKATLDALDAGALDFIPKRFEDISKNLAEVKKILCDKVREIGKHRRFNRPVSKALHPDTDRQAHTDVQPPKSVSTSSAKTKKFNLLAIGTSTGGPIALQEVLVNLPESFPTPIILVQHMPGTFTPAFASRLNQLCKINVKEAEDGESIKAGTAYLAPGGKQMLLKRSGSNVKVVVVDSDPTLTYKPSVDVTFKSIAEAYSDDVLAIILTGMGSDGCEGAKMLKQRGAHIWSQDKETCVVYGMPAAVADAGIVEKVLPLSSFSSHIIQEM